jgi:hypothetical protein
MVAVGREEKRAAVVAPTNPSARGGTVVSGGGEGVGVDE